jgi:hypothetical protein
MGVIGELSLGIQGIFEECLSLVLKKIYKYLNQYQMSYSFGFECVYMHKSSFFFIKKQQILFKN